MSFLDEFADYYVGKWVDNDGFILKPIVRKPAEKSEPRKSGFASALAVGLVASATLLGTPSESYAANTFMSDVHGMKPFASEKDVPDREQTFVRRTDDLLKGLQNCVPLAVSDEMLTLARQAVANPVNFKSESIEQWAERLVGAPR